MPGIIQVSVLEFMALPSSPPLSQMSIKVSMGKRYYQTRDKGEFSFPLTTLRDKLIVTLQDAQGKEVSYTVIETRLVIEKGIWDDIFQLEGGGHVHLKLQFVLSEEDRQRIRIMRESALRKKHDELLKSELRSSPRASSVRSDDASILQPNHEVSVIQAGLGSTTTSILFKKKSDPEDKEGTHSVQKQTKPNDTDRYEDTLSITPVSHRFDIRLEGVSHARSVEKDPIQTPAILNEDGANDIEKQSTIKKTPSKIRNMISAFESNVNQKQDMKPKIRPTSIKSESDKTRAEGSSSRHLNEVKVENAELAQLSDSVRNAIHTRDLELTPSLIREREEQIGIRTKGTTQNLKDKTKVKQKVNIQEEKTSYEGFARVSTSGRASVSGRMLNEKGRHPLRNLIGRRRLSGDKIVEQKSVKGIQPKDMQHLNNQDRASSNDPCPSECNGAWIFPDGGKRMCITTNAKQMMNLMGGFFAEAKNQLGNLTSPVAENAKQVEEDGEASQRYKEPKVDDSTDAETPRGPVGQVMRVVIMVGFATLVLFARQRKSDK
ncbi:uncharacterized protein LOC8272541 isoform X3 [Ricinus communis]|uniref:uncharacterized protein LOC8272541 isoform X3 n=1 Tax=Ricinus communis TaxID=3988 RepID=UPI0007729A9E|nr:uncharacterized protein LOC8272541 isoform X3 [Ricinus communis]|eukprot:XP_025012245.1 uncharacterized protein LOC8272541 isoform X3 [Ricinus communis]